MKQELINELNRRNLDISKLNTMIENGKPYYFLGFIHRGYESIGLFQPNQGSNIFHYLATKGAIRLLLPKFFGPKSTDILKREGIIHSELVEMISYPDTKGLTPAHYSVLHEPLALPILYNKGAALTSEQYSRLSEVANVIPISPLEFIFKSDNSEEKARKTAESFIHKAISSGLTEVITLICNEHSQIQKYLVEYLPYIIKTVQEIQNVNSLKVFDVIFENLWFDILIGDNEALNKMMRIFKILVTSEHFKGEDKDIILPLSLDDWSNLLSKGGVHKKFANYNEVRKHILDKCAERFLNGTLSQMELSDLMNEEAIAGEKFAKLKQFVELGKIEQIESSEDKDSDKAEAGVTNASTEQFSSDKSENAIELAAVRTATAVSIIDENIRQFATTPTVYMVGMLIDAGIMETRDSAVILNNIEASSTSTTGLTMATTGSLTPASSAGSLMASNFQEQQKKKEHQSSEVSARNSEPLASVTLPLPLNDYTRQVSIIEYADKVVAVAKKSSNCMIQITTDLGSAAIPLHMFISLAALPDDFFAQVLNSAARKLSTESKKTDDFFREYVEILTTDDLLYINEKNKLDAYGLACQRDQLNIARSLLTKGLKLDIYSEDTESVFDVPIKTNSEKILKYLFTEQETEQKAITINWHHILLKAIKYANVATVSYYVNSDEAAIDITTDRRGNCDAQERKYSILNKALDSLVELAQLERFHNKPGQMAEAIKKIPLLCECIELLIKSNKIYYDMVDKSLVSKKTIYLLKELTDTITSPHNQLELAQQAFEGLKRVKDLVVNNYLNHSDLSLNLKVAIERAISGGDDDTASQATNITKFSVLSVIGERWQGHRSEDNNDTSSSNEILATYNTNAEDASILTGNAGYEAGLAGIVAMPQADQ